LTLKSISDSNRILYETMNDIDTMIVDAYIKEPVPVSKKNVYKKHVYKKHAYNQNKNDEDKKKIRRQRNRIHAATSRENKKKKMTNLETENANLKEELNNLKNELLGVYHLYGNLRDMLDKLVY